MTGNCGADEAAGQGNPWYTRRVGWIISGVFVAITVVITCVNVTRHARNYRAAKEQRQIIRILYMPLIYAVVCWLAYRFIHYYVYLSLIYIAYEVIALSAFLYLMIQYVANAAAGSIEDALSKKDKTRLPAPWCCFRFRPTKSSFIHMVKWLVLQFVLIRPTITVISIILYALGLTCPTDMSATEPTLWLTIVDILSMITAMYGLILFYKLTNKEIREHRPLLKFAIIKGIVFLTIIQEIVFKSLHSSGKITPTESWSATEVADGLNAFLLTIEMAIASVVMLRAFSASEYSDPERPKGTAVQAIIDSWNFGDFFSDMKHSLLFFCRRPQIISHNGSQEPLNYEELVVSEATGNGMSLKEAPPKNETSAIAPPV
ncbi:unnamed protein product [Rhizoctonia solani]|uniref:Uncharacterized protein n=1 Tax=Rhizoctonia solani TaxID=456999 RepID=A0A8H3H985_9AGAM|nr:unnamed protein product [Rhizoctonia solani]CAE6489347.1 unnamed protein product [Rhizoctonia solani]